jgi:hypothetical protein
MTCLCAKRLWTALDVKKDSGYLLANSLKEKSDQDMVESVFARLHLRDDRANDVDQLQLFCVGQQPKRSDNFESFITRDAAAANLVNKKLPASLLGKSDRFALSFVQNLRQSIYD